jgi:hypothetical protein
MGWAARAWRGGYGWGAIPFGESAATAELPLMSIGLNMENLDVDFAGRDDDDAICRFYFIFADFPRNCRKPWQNTT